MERNYIIPLRKEWLKVPIYKRTKKAVNTTRAFLKKHMKTETVKLGRHLNMKLWSKGNRNPPGKVEVSAELIKDKEGDYVYAELVGVQKESLKPIVAASKATGIAGKLEELTGGKKAESKPNPKAEKQKAEEKKEKDKILKEKPAKKEQRDHSADGRDVKPEVNEKSREEQLVKRDNKQNQQKKE